MGLKEASQGTGHSEHLGEGPSRENRVHSSSQLTIIYNFLSYVSSVLHMRLMRSVSLINCLWS